MSKKHLPGIQIRIDKINSQRIRKWLRDIDWQIISSRIAKNGNITARDYKPPDGGHSRFHHLEELPTERGRFRPHYGDVGGGFEYYLRSHPQGTKLIGTCERVGFFYKITSPPLELILPNKIELQVYEEPSEGGGFIYPHDNQFIDGENTLGFYGDFFKLFHNWEWYSENIKPFEFVFVPMSIGCLFKVLHLETNTLLDLTKDIDW